MIIKLALFTYLISLAFSKSHNVTMEEKILNDHCERIIGSLKKSDVNFLAIDFDVSSHINLDGIKLNTGQM
jgi:hypothetical protein